MIGKDDRMKVEKFAVDKNIVSWKLGDNQVSIEIDNLEGAYLYLEGKTVLALTGEGNSPPKLIGYSIYGTRKFEVAAPGGFAFSYITRHPEVGVAVVCGGNEKVDGWYDWHFAIDVKTGKLTRHYPAY